MGLFHVAIKSKSVEPHPLQRIGLSDHHSVVGKIDELLEGHGVYFPVQGGES